MEPDLATGACLAVTGRFRGRGAAGKQVRRVGVCRRELGRCMERRQRGELGWWRWEPRPH